MSILEKGNRRLVASVCSQSITFSRLSRIYGSVHTSNISLCPAHPHPSLGLIIIPRVLARRVPNPVDDPSITDSICDISMLEFSRTARVSTYLLRRCGLEDLVQAIHVSSEVGQGVPAISDANEHTLSARCGHSILGTNGGCCTT